ncbi:MtN3-like protein [Hepatocystis sp. ex Piliocolobus tephrosceles]|nr:MtN3-like protein [Hepatocystis sp. ex Piliocolobus tephrosceles]
MWLKEKLYSYYKICGFTCFMLYIFLYVLTYEQYELFVGFMAFTSSIINFGAPLAYIVILSLQATSLVCSFLWLIYGLTLKDGFIILPNLCGFILSLLQLILIFIYSNNKNIKNFSIDSEIDNEARHSNIVITDKD